MRGHIFLTFTCFEVFVCGSYTLLTFHVRKGAIPVWFWEDPVVVVLCVRERERAREKSKRGKKRRQKVRSALSARRYLQCNINITFELDHLIMPQTLKSYGR